MRRFLNNRISNYNNVGDKVDDFCEDCENRWLPFSRVWWDSTEKNIANIKRKDNGIFVIKKILSLINSISESIKDIYDRINVIEPPILSEKLIELENDYLEVGVTADDKQEDLNIAIYENYINLKNTKVDKPLIESTSDSLKIVALDNQGESVFIKSNELGKVKSVNNKIGDVILKTSDLENDSDYTTNLKLNQERDERISGDNLKLDKPTTSGTITTHPNIVGVDDLGNSAKLKATDFGKVKSVNGKDGDVILKTSDLENDSDYTTNATLTVHTSNKSNPHNVTKSQIGLGNVDNTSDLNKPISTATQTELNKKLDKPTTNNTNQFVILGDGSTAPKSDFGKVDTIDGIEADENKNIALGAVRKSESNTVEDNFDIHLEGGAGVGIDAKGLKVFKGGITATYGTSSIYVDNLVPDAAYKFQEILFPKRAVKNVEEKVYPVTYIQGVKADETGRVDISGVAMNWTNSSQRFSGLLDKRADATFNRLLGMDANGNLNEVGIYALTNEMSKATDAQKDLWRNASRKSNETTGATVPSITAVNAITLGNNAGFNYPFSVLGVNLNLVQHVNLIKVKDEQGQLIPEESVSITNFTRDSATRITIEYPTNTFTNGFIVVEFVDSLHYSVRSEEIEVSDVIKSLTPPVVNWSYIGSTNRTQTNDVIEGNKITLLHNSTDRNQFTNRCNYETNPFITRDMVTQGFEITFKTNFVFKNGYRRIDGYPPIGIYLKTSDNIDFLTLNQDDIERTRYDSAYYKINTIQTTIYTGGTVENSIQNYLQQSYITIKYKNGLMNLIIYYEDGTIKNFKRSLYVPPSSSIVSGGLKVAIDIGGNYTPYQNAVLDRSIEIIDFKIK